MSEDVRGEVTRILGRIVAGDESAKEQLLQTAYDELRALAGRLMKQERPDHTLQPTALVNEAALRLLQEDALERMPNRAYFFGTMATAMRRVLVDHARARRAGKRGGDGERTPLDAVVDQLQETQQLDLLALDEALARLEALSERQARIVSLRFFGGLELAEIARQLEVSLSTVEKEWRMARAWLRQQLEER
jgi:RNA polymerase sigma factor (TIGR02999 family)